MKKIALLGATGSIGRQTMDIVFANPDQYQVIGISAGQQIDQVRSYLHKQHIPHVCVAHKDDASRLSLEFPAVQFYHGSEGLQEIATLGDSDVVVNALVGFVGLQPTMAAIQSGKQVALANKETLVVAGELITKETKKNGKALLPIDSEHSAIFQCLLGHRRDDISKIIITASGGSFRDYTREQLTHVTKEGALAHPSWSMGSKITIDSATMMNKGFEVIEAHYLFNQPYDKIEVVLHRQSTVHSMVQYQDHSIIAQIGSADMRIPIQFALSYPRHLPMAYDNALSFDKLLTWTFEPMDFARFPLLRIAYDVGKAKGTHPTVLNSANEVAVARFLNDEIAFLAIEDMIEQALSYFANEEASSLAKLLEVDQATRAYVQSLAG